VSGNRLAFKNHGAVKALFAALASAEYDDVDMLSESAHARLKEQVEEAAKFKVHNLRDSAPVSVVLVAEPAVNPANLLRTLLPKVNFHLGCLLQWEGVRLPVPGASVLTYLHTSREMLVEIWETRTVEQMLVAEFVRLLREQPFPYRKCPHCEAVFVRYRRQKFCGPVCTYAATHARRGEAKREAMRTHMREKRARERAQA